MYYSALLCTTTYDQWHSVKDTLDAITNPNTSVADKMHLDDNQRRALEDYMCGSVLVRYNRIWMDKDNLQLPYFDTFDALNVLLYSN